MRKIRTLALLAATLPLQAQDVKTLSLKDALQYALQNKAEAKKAQLDVENSRYKIAEVRANALPQLNVGSGLNYNAILQQSALPGEIFGAPAGSVIMVAFGQKWNTNAVATLSQNLFNQSVFTGLKAAKTTREFYAVNKQLTEEQLIEKVASGYYQVYVTKQQLAIVESNLESAKKVLAVLQGQYENGLARKIDFERLSVKVSNIEASRQKLENAVQLQENALKFFIGMPMEQAVSLPEDTFAISVEAFTENVDISNRTELALLKKQEELLHYQKQAYVAEAVPSLSLNANYGYQGLGNTFPWGAKPADGVFYSDFASIGLNFRIPIFNGFSTRSRIRQAKISLEKTAEDIKDTQLALNFAFQNAKTQLNNSIINIKTQKENAVLAKKVFENTQNNYINGLASLTDLLDAENAMTDAQNHYTTAQLEYKLAELQIIKSKGELKSLTN